MQERDRQRGLQLTGSSRGLRALPGSPVLLASIREWGARERQTERPSADRKQQGQRALPGLQCCWPPSERCGVQERDRQRGLQEAAGGRGHCLVSSAAGLHQRGVGCKRETDSEAFRKQQGAEGTAWSPVLLASIREVWGARERQTERPSGSSRGLRALPGLQCCWPPSERCGVQERDRQRGLQEAAGG